MTKADRFAMIAETWDKLQDSTQASPELLAAKLQMAWLIAEVRRARKVEDAVLELRDIAESPVTGADGALQVLHLVRALFQITRDNPRSDEE